MASDSFSGTASAAGARKLANTTKTPAQWSGITPRWLVGLLPWTPVEAGTYRVNRALADQTRDDVDCSPEDGQAVSRTFVDYDPNPREYTVNSVSTILDIQTRVADLYRSPFDQVKEQLRILIEVVKEKQEDQLINNDSYGLLNNVAPSMRLKTRKGPPTPDDMDELISLVWKEPSFFLAHPRAIAAFGRECTKRGVPPATVSLFGSPFLTWRGLPIVPCDKLRVTNLGGDNATQGVSDILLMRTGEKKQGVVGLFQPGLQGEVSPSLSVRFMGIREDAVASYLISLYCSAAVLTEDALGALSGVEVDHYNDPK